MYLERENNVLGRVHQPVRTTRARGETEEKANQLKMSVCLSTIDESRGIHYCFAGVILRKQRSSPFPSSFSSMNHALVINTANSFQQWWHSAQPLATSRRSARFAIAVRSFPVDKSHPVLFVTRMIFSPSISVVIAAAKQTSHDRHTLVLTPSVRRCLLLEFQTSLFHRSSFRPESVTCNGLLTGI